MAKRKERVIQLVNKGCGQKWLFGVEYMESQSWGSPPSTTRSLSGAEGQGPRSRRAGQVWAA